MNLATKDGISLPRSVSSVVSAAIERIGAFGPVLAQRRMLQDLVTARQIQRSFLPVLETLVEGFCVSTEYRPAHDVGGDFYDVFETGAGRITAVIGDVSGKGVSGALVMARISSDIRRIAPRISSPRHLIQQLNAAFSSFNTDLFATAVCVMLDATRCELTMCNAGHVLPLVRRAAGAVIPIGGASGPPIGTCSDHVYQDETFPLALGDVVLLMTDGITEALHTSQDLFGRAALGNLISLAPPIGREINRRILRAIEALSEPRALDDIALLSLDLTADAWSPRSAGAARRVCGPLRATLPRSFAH